MIYVGLAHKSNILKIIDKNQHGWEREESLVYKIYRPYIVHSLHGDVGMIHLNPSLPYSFKYTDSNFTMQTKHNFMQTKQFP